MSVFIYANQPSFSASGLLAYAINKYCENVIAMFRYTDIEEFHKYCKYYNATFGFPPRLSKEVLDCNQWIFCAGKSLKEFVKNYSLSKDFLRTKKIKLIATDTQFCNEFEEMNGFLKDVGAILFAMPDLYPFCYYVSPIPYYPAVDLSLEETFLTKKYLKDNRNIILCHSPFKKFERNTKGSQQIVSVFKKMEEKYKNVKSIIIVNSRREETLMLKRSSHIFVDQMVYGNGGIPLDAWNKRVKYMGALAKSGCEAMFLKSLVITGAPLPETVPYFPPPPACFVNYAEFEKILDFYIVNKEQRDLKIEQQYNYAKKYLSFEFVSKHVYNNNCNLMNNQK